jgi:cytochrome c5
MRVASIAAILACVLAGASSLRAGQGPALTSAPAAAPSRTAASVDPGKVVETYCAGCHNGVTRSASKSLLDRFDLATIAENRDVWASAARQLRAGTMPPVGSPRPDRQTANVLLASIEKGLGADAPLGPSVTASQTVAERLASLLWNRTPDAPLLDEARRNRLTQPAVVEQQVQRMLADDRAEAFVSRFFFPWLGLDQLGKDDPDKAYFPDFDLSLRDAMTKETNLFIRSQLRENRDPIELWNAGYTFLNEPLARHYGVTGVTGAEFRRVTLSSPERAGLLGQGSILMVTSRFGKDQRFTSPAARSTWLRMHFLGAKAPNPAPNATPVKPDLPITPQTRLLPAEPCVNCHRNFFPLGYALENFDSLGRWRTSDQLGPVDASGSYVDGTPTNGIVQLRTVLLQYPDAFRTTITEKLVAYAAGEPVAKSNLTPDTLVRARQILHATPSARWSSIIAALVM